MFIFKRIRGVVVPPCTSLCVGSFSSCHRLRSPKKRSPYSSVDSERYSSLVKAVITPRFGAQTPDSILAEDEHMYGPVVKGQATPRRAQERAPKTMHPFLGCEETEEQEGSGPPTRIPLKRGQGGTSKPSVTRILQQTLSPEQVMILERWKKRMIAELGEEGFNNYSQNLFRLGKLFHSSLEDILESPWKENTEVSETPEPPPEDPPELQRLLQSVSHILEDVREVKAIESMVQHDALGYVGIADCVARYRGVLCVIDWKTSEKPKPFLSNTYDNPIQVAAYAGALNNDGNYKYQVENGLIVVAYKDGTPAHAHQMNSELMSEYWRTWLIRLEQFTEQRSSNASEKR